MLRLAKNDAVKSAVEDKSYNELGEERKSVRYKDESRGGEEGTHRNERWMSSLSLQGEDEEKCGEKGGREDLNGEVGSYQSVTTVKVLGDLMSH